MRDKDWLKKQRLTLNFTQAQIAELAGVSLYTIQNLEQGKRKGSDDVWEKLEEALVKEGGMKKIRADILVNEEQCKDLNIVKGYLIELEQENERDPEVTLEDVVTYLCCLGLTRFKEQHFKLFEISNTETE